MLRNTASANDSLQNVLKNINNIFDDSPVVGRTEHSLQMRINSAISSLQQGMKAHPPSTVQLIMHNNAPALKLTFPPDFPYLKEVKEQFTTAAFTLSGKKAASSFIIHSSFNPSPPSFFNGNAHPGYPAAVVLAKFPSLIDPMEISPEFLTAFHGHYQNYLKKNDRRQLSPAEAKEYPYLEVDALDFIINHKTTKKTSAVDPSFEKLKEALDAHILLVQRHIRQKLAVVHRQKKSREPVKPYEAFEVALRQFKRQLLGSIPSSVSLAEATTIAGSAIHLASVIGTSSEKSTIAAAAKQFEKDSAALAKRPSNWPTVIGALIGAVAGILLGSLFLGFGAPAGAVIGAYLGGTLGGSLLGGSLGFWSRSPAPTPKKLLQAAEQIQNLSLN